MRTGAPPHWFAADTTGAAGGLGVLVRRQKSALGDVFEDFEDLGIDLEVE
jgi:hypothetical protein